MRLQQRPYWRGAWPAARTQLKELELLREMLAGTSTTFVFGGGDIADQVRSLVTANKV